MLLLYLERTFVLYPGRVLIFCSSRDVDVLVGKKVAVLPEESVYVLSGYY